VRSMGTRKWTSRWQRRTVGIDMRINIDQAEETWKGVRRSNEQRAGDR